MGFWQHVFLPGFWVALVVGEAFLFWIEPAFLGFLPFEIWFLILSTAAFGSLKASLLYLFSYLLWCISTILYVLAVIVVCIRFALLLTLSSILFVSFRVYLGVYLALGRLLPLPRLLFISLLSPPLSLFSKACVLRWPRFRTKLPESELCSTCERMIDRSALLTGTWSLLAKRVESHSHHTARDLEISAKQCALCHLLPGPKSMTGPATSSSNSLNENISLEEGREETLEVKIWEEGHVLAGQVLRMQLIGDQFKSEELVIGRVKNVSEYRPRSQLDAHREMTNSSDVLLWAREQIHVCESDHDNCGTYFMKESQRSFCPARLIDTGEIGDATVRLITESELPANTNIKYVALSHRWSPREKMNTVLSYENLEAMMQPTFFHEWNVNFQHAIYITRHLGIRYLWIDVFCIIQDSDDWKKQAPKMGLIYANATCVLSATAAKDSDGGCIFPRINAAGGCQLRRQGNTSLHVNPSAQLDTIMTNLFKAKVDDAELTSRGWTFQERVLASRILHFCEGTVLFECNQIQASSSHGFAQPYSKRKQISLDGRLQTFVGPTPPSESFLPPIHIPTFELPSTSADRMFSLSEETVREARVSTRPLSRPARGTVETTKVNINWNLGSSFSDWFGFEYTDDLIESLGNFQSYQEYLSWKTWRGEVVESARLGMRGAFEALSRFKGTELAERFEFHCLWYEIVEKYSTRVLTKDNDKLAAIEGLSEFVRPEFVAGLWEEVLPFNLLWTLKGTKPLPRPRDRGIPTWSWASVDGCISHQLRKEPSFNPFAQGRGEHPDVYITKTIPYEKESQDLCTQIVEVRFRIPLFDLNRLRHHFLCDISLANEEYEGLFCLAVLLFKNTGNSYEASRELHGIVVSPVANSACRFERVGYFWAGDEIVIKESLQGLTQDAVRAIELV
ncbi:heterokaryon incompatibility protein-domain-containing protein [Hypoxylon trugodes]|uniref:heterokaryon incompatibility protein-domain-containing protein n=1 Tax=Hypoxylon trugodes TaxID=326681 RepID=UPI0021953B9A|nr:heterokaryon incompatibility protein-domain-containing protein [Hypoxylon trugodes]KAI1387330.1 heterokaryon incompatibility protein-domain-containing protein [Hypoxylon trugodes]